MTLAKYEAILEEIRHKPKDPALPAEAFLVGRSILSVASIQRDVDEAREAGKRFVAAVGEFESLRPPGKSNEAKPDAK